MKAYLLICSLLFSFLLGAKESRPIFKDDRLALKAGVGFYHSTLEQNGRQAKRFGPSFNPQIGYRLGSFELLVNGLITLGQEKSMTFTIDNKDLAGDVRTNEVLFSPMIKYITPISVHKNNWPIYIAAGPAWSLHSFNFRDNQAAIQAGFNIASSKFKLAYDTSGYAVALGVQELTTYKEMHPIFIELVWIHNKSHRVGLLDTSKFHKTNEVFRESNHALKQSMVLLNMGLTLF